MTPRRGTPCWYYKTGLDERPRAEVSGTADVAVGTGLIVLGVFLVGSLALSKKPAGMSRT